MTSRKLSNQLIETEDGTVCALVSVLARRAGRVLVTLSHIAPQKLPLYDRIKGQSSRSVSPMLPLPVGPEYDEGGGVALPGGGPLSCALPCQL